MEILIILFAIIYFILAWKRLDWAVMILIAALPAYQIRFTVFGMPLTALELMVLIAFGAWVIWHTEFLQYVVKPGRWQRYKTKKQERVPYPFGWEIGLLLFISWIAMAVSGFSDSALGIWKAYFFEPALVFILILNVYTNRTNRERTERIGFLRLEKFLWPLCISALLVSLAAVFQKVTGLWAVAEFWPRVTGVFPYPNALGLYLGPLALLFLGWWLYLVRIEKKRVMSYELWVIGLTILLSLLAIYFARSEGALAGIGAALIVMGSLWLVHKHKYLRQLPKVIIVSILLFVIFSSVFFLKVVPEYKYWQTDNKILDYIIYKATLKDLSGEIRKQQWRETYAMLQEDGHWLLGAGLANYQAGIQPYHQEGIFFNKDNDLDFRQKIVWFDEKYKAQRWQPAEIYLYPHNILLNFWTELGLAGALLFIWIIFKFIFLGVKLIRNPKGGDNNYLVLGLIGGMVVIIVHGIVDVPYFKNDLAIMFWVLVAMVSLVNLEFTLRR